MRTCQNDGFGSYVTVMQMSPALRPIQKQPMMLEQHHSSQGWETNLPSQSIGSLKTGEFIITRPRGSNQSVTMELGPKSHTICGFMSPNFRVPWEREIVDSGPRICSSKCGSRNPLTRFNWSFKTKGGKSKERCTPQKVQMYVLDMHVAARTLWVSAVMLFGKASKDLRRPLPGADIKALLFKKSKVVVWRQDTGMLNTVCRMLNSSAIICFQSRWASFFSFYAAWQLSRRCR